LPNDKNPNLFDWEFEGSHHLPDWRGDLGIAQYFGLYSVEQIPLTGKRYLPAGVHLLEEHG
jgi:hypothetical protein